ncbi:DHH family protein [Vibrio thalassae]|uniref:DHH family protein n=1 Tax=Vibrio thalassae TaxID=1243014 RepID=A0A240EI70_9VIBR|nr:DHH family phosphoesterase [Vibrio thalassae]SNX47879.1 DHH family protein [Vibrio thalassae]
MNNTQDRNTLAKIVCSTNNIHVIYHGNCMDGTASAWAARYWLSKADKNLSFEKGFYGKAVDDYEIPDDTELVLMVDFSMKSAELDQMAAKFKVAIIDHHDSAQRELNNVAHPNIFKVFDMTESGATLTWRVFSEYENLNPAWRTDDGCRIPTLLKHVRDRDLWQWKLKDTKAVALALNHYGLGIDDFDHAYNQELDELVAFGTPMVLYHQSIVENIACSAKEFEMLVDSGSVVVPIVTCSPMFISDVAQEIYNKMDVPFVLLVNSDLKGGFKCSLRSKQGTGHVVNGIAESFGGGGHQYAAGFYVTETQFYEMGRLVKNA